MGLRIGLVLSPPHTVGASGLASSSQDVILEEPGHGMDAVVATLVGAQEARGKVTDSGKKLQLRLS